MYKFIASIFWLHLTSIECLAVPTITVSNQEGVCLLAHNTYRRLHVNTPPLKWSRVLAKKAATWAAYLAYTSKVEHSSKESLGENIYWARGPRAISCAEAVWSWYNEYQVYNYRNSMYKKSTGHFMQLVWRETKHVGVGIAVKKQSPRLYQTYIVALYSPMGNTVMNGDSRNSFQRNVWRRIKGATVPGPFELDRSICRDTVTKRECHWLVKARFCSRSRLIGNLYCPRACKRC